jgi:hypothetical protein
MVLMALFLETTRILAPAAVEPVVLVASSKI